MLKKPLPPLLCQPLFFFKSSLSAPFYAVFFTPSLCDWHVGVYWLAHPSPARQWRAPRPAWRDSETLTSLWLVCKMDREVPPSPLFYFLSSFKFSPSTLHVLHGAPDSSFPPLLSFFSWLCPLCQWSHAERGTGAWLYIYVKVCVYVCVCVEWNVTHPTPVRVYTSFCVFVSVILIQTRWSNKPPQTTN